MRIEMLTLLAVAAFAAGGCGDQPQPTGPTQAHAIPTGRPTPTPAQNEWLARRVARAMGSPAFRALVKAQLDHSPIREHKLQFQRFLEIANWRPLNAIARENGEVPDTVGARAALAQPLEFYMPVPAHRAAWTGDAHVLVATAVGDHDAPVAFDPEGNRYVLDPKTPPSTPVLALVPVETNFDSPPARIQCTQETCGGGGGTPDPTHPAAGLYMTASHIPDIRAFESWLKGDPEFEVHILGQQGTSGQLTDYQCAGEKAGGPYFYDQNAVDWWGSVLLFSQDQLNTFKTQHPGQAVRVFVVEDDDTACQLRLDDDRVGRIFTLVDSLYGKLSGGRDSLLAAGKVFHSARAAQSIIAAIASLILTNDDPVGNAVEDAVVGQFYPGYNWFLKGDNTITNGWINLEMH